MKVEHLKLNVTIKHLQNVTKVLQLNGLIENCQIF